MAGEKDFNPGDIVRVKSGGPVMTVSGIRDAQLYCAWWNPKLGKLSYDFFYPALVEKVDKPDIFLPAQA